MVITSLLAAMGHVQGGGHPAGPGGAGHRRRRGRWLVVGVSRPETQRARDRRRIADQPGRVPPAVHTRTARRELPGGPGNGGVPPPRGPGVGVGDDRRRAQPVPPGRDTAPSGGRFSRPAANRVGTARDGLTAVVTVRGTSWDRRFHHGHAQPSAPALSATLGLGWPIVAAPPVQDRRCPRSRCSTGRRLLTAVGPHLADQCTDLADSLHAAATNCPSSAARSDAVIESGDRTGEDR